ncbi:transmembrane protein, putative (macronuclear) [Tetrahymena thermophila SB210]|uniref:Transmembrane protein, putative n=1 Tax=Tetrahymena thermophila (strain SB210) TaxID=312017 RepID=Q247R8_TETTS|nr:transmembrane protein, putative [Tetrahymena thermophila SB210]EAS04032.1 transmembrane protein, putative [Tetrahymena thermophila SB210]|eukprot:XP_001024277.1 transmembrane protein, putative [Tetrahymena thermophila SB210]
MTNYFTKTFAKFDIFGSEVGLNYQKDNIFKTTFGGFMTLGFFAFLGVFFWNNIFSFLNKENVFATTNKQFYSDPPVVALNPRNFMFAVQINQDDFIQSPYLNITFETRDYVTFPNGTKTKRLYPTQLEPCTPEHWSQLPKNGFNWTEAFYQNGLQQFLCPTKDYEFMLGGTYISENFYHWKFSITKCSNKTLPNALWKPACKSDQQFEAYFNKTQNIRFKIYTSNFVINALESKNYVNSYVEDSIFFLIQNKNSYITSDIYFSENVIQTDESLLPFPSILNETIVNFQAGNFRPQYTFGQVGDVFADFFIRKDPFVYKINRSFQKISQIISYIGGFAQIFILVTAILVNQYNEYVYAISLANKIYDFQFSSNEGKKSKQTKYLSQNNDNRKSDGQYKPSFFESLTKKNSFETKSNHNQIAQTDQLDLEKQVIKKDDQQEMEINISNKNQKKIIKREDDGLLPFDELKAIILQRKLQIEQQQQNQQQQKLSALNQKKQLIKTEEDTVQEQQEVTINQVQIIDKDKDSIIKKSDDIQPTSELRIHNEQQMPAHRIESKNLMNESIHPESPLEIEKRDLFSLKEINTKNEDKIINIENTRQTIQLDKNEFKSSLQEQPNSNVKQVLKIQNLNQDVNSCENIFTYNQNSNTPNNNLARDTPKSKFFSQNNILLHGLGYQNQKQFLQKEFEFLLKKQSTLKMTFKYFLYKLTCHKFFKTEQVLLLDKVNQQMKKDLDIFTIINRIKEIEKFKKLFLDKNQQILFNFFPKPVISVQNEEQNLTRADIEEQLKESKMKDSQQNVRTQRMSQYQQKKLNINIKIAAVVQKAANKFKKPLISKVNEYNTLNTYNMLYTAYEQLIAEGQNSKFNKKLIELLGDELSNIFEISTMLANKGKISQKQNFTQMIHQNKIQQQIELADLNSKRNIFSEQMTSLPSTERKLGFYQNQQ